MNTETRTIRQLETEIIRHGQGPSLLYLHSHLGFWKSEAFMDALAKHYSVIAPFHPGFGGSKVADYMASVDDLSYFYLDLIDELGLTGIPVVGSSFGGWLALSIAVKRPEIFSSLTLINPVGLHFGGATDEDIADIFSLDEIEFSERGFANPSNGRKDYKSMSDEELLISSRNREATARYAWSPCFYDPKLKHNLHRISSPVRILWGAQDKLTSDGYGQKFADILPHASYAELPDAGHFPSIETPAEAASEIAAFLASDEAKIAASASKSH